MSEQNAKNNKNKFMLFSGFMKNITMVTQFGLSLLTPTLICLFACWWLVEHTGVGQWIYIIGFIFGTIINHENFIVTI